MGKMWQELDEKAKGPYEKKAEAAKKKYAEEMAAYEAWTLVLLHADLFRLFLYLVFWTIKCIRLSLWILLPFLEMANRPCCRKVKGSNR